MQQASLSRSRPRSALWNLLGCGALVACVASACGSSERDGVTPGANNGGDGGPGSLCGTCTPTNGYISCDAAGKETTTPCPVEQVCAAGKGCVACVPGATICVGNEVHTCTPDSKAGETVNTCDATKGQICQNGACVSGCEAAAAAQSNIGCEFWAANLDLSDITPVGQGPWGVVLSSASQIPADITIERNDAPQGQPAQPVMVVKTTLPPNQLIQLKLPMRQLDCGAQMDDHNAPGTCLSSNAYRITSSAPIVAVQFNNMAHKYATDASLLLPTSVLGKVYRNVGWPTANPFPSPGAWTMRAYVTIVGTTPNTVVNVSPAFRIKGNGPIPATDKNGNLSVTIGPFDVLNLETDDSKQEDFFPGGKCFKADVKPPYCNDLTGTVINTNAPVAVFSGVESAGVGPSDKEAQPPSWHTDNPDVDGTKGCCKQHLEEQIAPLEAAGKKFVVTRSPIRSDAQFTDWVEPDVYRFVGGAAPSHVKTNLPAPMNDFTILPGQIIDTWTKQDFVVDASEPLFVSQFLVAQDYVEPQPKGDPSFTIYPPIEQAKSEYIFLSLSDWKENYVVIGTEQATNVTIDGQPPQDCVLAEAGQLDGKTYQSRRCKLPAGVHRLSGNGPFQIMVYGYDDADVYAYPGGAFVKKIYEPPPIK